MIIGWDTIHRFELLEELLRQRDMRHDEVSDEREDDGEQQQQLADVPSQVAGASDVVPHHPHVHR